MSDLDNFFNDPNIGNEENLRIFKSNKSIFDLNHKNTQSCNNNLLIGWFKNKGITLTADIAAEFIVRVFYQNPDKICTKTIDNKLKSEMRWDPTNVVISLQRGFVATLKPNTYWKTTSWDYSKIYFIQWLNCVIKDMTKQLNIQMNPQMNPHLIITSSDAVQLAVQLAVQIASILIEDSADKLPDSHDRLKIRKTTQSNNRKNYQKLSKWDSNTNFTAFLRKAVGLPPRTSSNKYKAKEARYGLVEDIFQDVNEIKIRRGNVLMCVACKIKGNYYSEMVWPTQKCISCQKSDAYINEWIWPDNSERFKVPARVCSMCGIQKVKGKETVLYLFVNERNKKAKAVQVTTASTLQKCNGGTCHTFLTGPGKSDTTVFIKYLEAKKIVLEMIKKGFDQNTIKEFFGNNKDNIRLINEIYKHHITHIESSDKKRFKYIKNIHLSNDLSSLYTSCSDLKDLDIFKSAITFLFQVLLKDNESQLKQKLKYLNDIKKMDDDILKKLKVMMQEILNNHVLNNTSKIEYKKAANMDFDLKQKVNSD